MKGGKNITLDATLLRLKADEEGMDGSAELLSHVASARAAGASSDLICKRLEYLCFPSPLLCKLWHGFLGNHNCCCLVLF